MNESIAINMLRVSLPDEGSSPSLDNNKLLSVIADTFSRDKELREVFVRMTESGLCARMYLQRQSPDFASYVQDNMESFMNNNSYESDVVQRTFSLWAKTVCPTYIPLSKNTRNAPIPIHHRCPQTQSGTSISIVSKYKPPKIKAQPKNNSKVWRVTVIVLIVLMGLALIGWLWMHFPIARIIICILAAVILFMALIIFLEA